MRMYIDSFSTAILDIFNHYLPAIGRDCRPKYVLHGRHSVGFDFVTEPERPDGVRIGVNFDDCFFGWRIRTTDIWISVYLAGVFFSVLECLSMMRAPNVSLGGSIGYGALSAAHSKSGVGTKSHKKRK